MKKLNEECGVFGIIDFGAMPAAHYTATALLALQHRGQQSCGIAYVKEGSVAVKKNIGLVGDVFTPEVLESMPETHAAIGHVRYAELSENTFENAQPLLTRHSKLTFAICHNGNITNADVLRDRMMNRRGKIFYSTNDSEIISKLIIEQMLAGDTVEQALVKILNIIEGAYSLVLVTENKIVAARDKNGFRPLCLGKMGSATVIASETCAFNSIGGVHVRDIKPGEVYSIDTDGNEIILQVKPGKRALCVFELVYFARPDSLVDGISVYRARIEMGKQLAAQMPTDADIVCGVPDSGNDAAQGFSMESGIPYGTAFVRNRYIGRSFIIPTQEGRQRAVGNKLNPLTASIKGKRVVLVDDSIVRGTTSANIIKMLREAGAKEVHMRISSPPFIAPCHFGTDIDSKDKLIACRLTEDEICKQIGADSLVFLDLDKLLAIKDGQNDIEFCNGCFTDKYPIKVKSVDPEKI